MSFLLPAAFWTLLIIPVILILHLLRNRRKELTISSLRLWYNLQQRKQGSRPRRIPLTLMLILQLIIAGALVLALARPASSFLLDQPKHNIYILDTTTSMTAVDVPQTASGQNQNRFDTARQMIKDYISTMAENDSIAVITLSATPQVLFTSDAEQSVSALKVLDNLLPGADGADLSAALTLTSGLIDPEIENNIIVLTDGNYALDNQILPDVLAPVQWQIIPASPDTNNQTLLNVSAQRTPDGRQRVFARAVNYSNVSVDRTLRLMIDGLVSDEEVVTIEPFSDVSRAWTLSGQAENASVEIVEPDSLPLDNIADVLLLDTVNQQVLLVSDTSDLLTKVLEVQPGVKLTVIPASQTGYNPADYDLIVFDGLPLELSAWPVGNILVVNPPLGHPLLVANNYARNLRPNPNSTLAMFNDIDLSGVYFSKVPRVNDPDWAVVDLQSMNTETEAPLSLVFHGIVADSQIVVWAFDLTESNLPARLAMPLLTANTLSTLLAPSPPDTIFMGQPIQLTSNFNVETPAGHRLYMNADDPTDTLFSQTKEPGLYTIYNSNNSPVAGFAVHAGSPKESNLIQRFDPKTVTELDALAIPAPELDIAFEEFWPWLAGLALAVITIEGWLAWRK